jgi:hypothetical protein
VERSECGTDPNGSGQYGGGGVGEGV